MKKKQKNKRKNQVGITLIGLVITIVILLILAGVSIAILTGNDGIITKAQKAKMATELSGYKEELEIYIMEKMIEDRNFNEKSLIAGKNLLFYDGQQEGETGTIKDIISSINKGYLEKLEIIKGELLINTKNEKEIEVAQSLGIEVNPYEIEDGELLSSSGNLLLVDETGTLRIPSSVTKIGSGAFANTASDGKKLKKIIIPGYVKEIAANAFSYNTTLEEVVMEDGVEKVGANAFYGCTELKEISFPDSVTSIGGYCLSSCKGLIQLKLSKSITTIPVQLCSGDSNLIKIEIPEGVITIGNYAFYKCSKITSISLPSTLQTIEGSAFGEMLNLAEINISSSNEYFKFNDGLLLSKDGTNLYYALLSLQTITILEGVTNTTNRNTRRSEKYRTVCIPNLFEFRKDNNSKYSNLNRRNSVYKMFKPKKNNNSSSIGKYIRKSMVMSLWNKSSILEIVNEKLL